MNNNSIDLDDYLTRLRLVSDPDTSWEIIEKVLAYRDLDLILAVNKRPDAEEYGWTGSGLEDFTQTEIKLILRDTNLPEDLLCYLSCKGANVCISVLKHPNCNRAVLEIMIDCIQKELPNEETLDGYVTPLEPDQSIDAESSNLKQVILLLLAHHACPENYLDTWARRTNFWLTSVEDEDPLVSVMVDNPAIQPGTLCYLYWHTPYGGETWQKVASHRYVDAEGIERARREILEDDFMAFHAETFLEWSGCHPDILHRIALDDDYPLVLAAIKHNNVSVDTLLLLSSFGEDNEFGQPSPRRDELRYAQYIDNGGVDYSNWSWHGGFIIAVAARRSPKHPIHEANSGDATPEVLMELLKFNAYDVDVAVAQNPNITPDVLDALARSKRKYGEVLSLVANNPLTRPETVSRLIKDGLLHPQDVARNRLTPVKLLDQWAKSEDNGYHLQLASNPSSSADSLRHLAESASHYVRINVVGNPNCPGSVIISLMEDDNTEVRDAAKSRLFGVNCPPDALWQLAKSTDDEMRLYVSKHRNTDTKTFAILARDKNPAVRNSVLDNRYCPNVVRARLELEKQRSGKQ